MHRLIDDILELSAIEAGRVVIEPGDVKLSLMVEGIFTDLSARAREKHVRLENRVPKEALVFADAVRLEQILTNLIDNAIKFNRERGGVTVSYEAAGEKKLIRVADTGEGISPEHLQRIFERFYRTDRARSREIGGTGLGLAIVKHLARLHGGEVSAESTPGKGSVFTLELPREPLAK
jgi:two-component system phosphate regulon sensor histidine kinase PhoR